MPRSSRCWHGFVQNPSFSETQIRLIIYRKKLNNLCAQILVGFPLLIRQRMLVSQPPYLILKFRSISHFFPLTVFRSIYVLVGILFNQLHRYRADLSLLAGCVLVAVGLGAINCPFGRCEINTKASENLGSCSAMLKLSKYQI